MPTINLKIAAIAALLVAFIAFAMHYDYLREESDRKDAEIARLDEVLAEKNRAQNLTDKARTEAERLLTVAKDEIKKRDDCIASGACKRVVRVKQACKLPQAESASGIAEGYAELDSSVQRAATDFEYRLAEQESKLALCLAYARGVSKQ